MKHYSSGEWSDYLEGKTDRLEKAFMEEHMVHCERCAGKYIEVLEASTLLHTAPDDTTDRVLSAVAGGGVQREFPRIAAQTRMKMFFKYAVAASLTLALWQFGIFNSLTGNAAVIDKALTGGIKHEPIRCTGFGTQMVEHIHGWFDYLSQKGEDLLHEDKK